MSDGENNNLNENSSIENDDFDLTNLSDNFSINELDLSILDFGFNDSINFDRNRVVSLYRGLPSVEIYNQIENENENEIDIDIHELDPLIHQPNIATRYLRNYFIDTPQTISRIPFLIEPYNLYRPDRPPVYSILDPIFEETIPLNISSIVFPNYTYTNKDCCICFNNQNLPILVENKYNFDTKTSENNEISIIDFKKAWEIEFDILLLSSCKEHYFCKKCLRILALDFENHIINEKKALMYCVYPFKDCSENYIDNSHIKNILTDSEFKSFMNHANQYRFIGFEIIKCPMVMLFNQSICGAEILVDLDEIKTKTVGNLIVECNQNNYCCRKFCYHCRTKVYNYSSNCNLCSLKTEHENPEARNHHFNKEIKKSESENEDGIDYFECMYLNKELTTEIIFEQLDQLLLDIFTWMICPICKFSIYKTEKCNGLMHHRCERCYACGRIGEKTGLINHWCGYGKNGCPRYDSESYYIDRFPDDKLRCIENECFNHSIGECKRPEHLEYINFMYDDKLKAYIFHAVKSLSNKLRIETLDYLYQSYPDKLYLFPSKTTFEILETDVEYYKCYSEDIIIELENEIKIV